MQTLGAVYDPRPIHDFVLLPVSRHLNLQVSNQRAHLLLPAHFWQARCISLDVALE